MIGEHGYPTLVVQEGGYRVRTLGANARNFFTGLVAGRSAVRQVAPALARAAGPSRGVVANGLDWRSAVMVDDVGRVRSLVASTGLFNPAEVEIASELVNERLVKGIRSGYQFVLAERGANLVAFACYGPIRGTQDAFDLFWIAVSPDEQRQGLGAQIYARAEAAMVKAGAKRIYADTSSSERYAGTRDFYQGMGFSEQARIADFYAPGDGKIIYMKPLAAAGTRSPRQS
jgi:ribosomal protein S18 acetylase RimI-like enzyme